MSVAPNDPKRSPPPDSSENPTTRGNDAGRDMPKPDDAAGKTPRGGDRNTVNIGEGAQVDQIAVGRNILQAKLNIGSLVIPVRFLLALLVVAAVGAVVVWWVVVSGEMPDGSPLNIAVVDFAEQDAAGNSINGSHGRDLSEWLASRLGTELGAAASDNPPVVWHIATGFEPVHLFQKRIFAAPVRNADDAQAVVDQFKADVVIYGNVSPGQDTLTFVPQFHINEKTGQQEVPELTGSQQMGRKITLPNPVTIGAKETFLQPLGQVIYWLARGVSFDLVGQFDRGYRELKQGQADLDAMNDEQGKEVFFYFLGTEALFLAQCEQDAARVFSAPPGGTAMQAALDAAEAAYNEAKRIQPGYARAIFGLGQVASQRGQRLMAAADATTFGQCRVANVSPPDPNLPIQCPVPPPPTNDPARLEQARIQLEQAIALQTEARDMMQAAADALLKSRVQAAREATELALAQQELLGGQFAQAETRAQSGVTALEAIRHSTDVKTDPRSAATLSLAIGGGHFIRSYARLMQNDQVGFKDALTRAIDALDSCLNIIQANASDTYLQERLAGNCTCLRQDAVKARGP